MDSNPKLCGPCRGSSTKTAAVPDRYSSGKGTGPAIGLLKSGPAILHLCVGLQDPTGKTEYCSGGQSHPQPGPHHPSPCPFQSFPHSPHTLPMPQKSSLPTALRLTAGQLHIASSWHCAWSLLALALEVCCGTFATLVSMARA